MAEKQMTFRVNEELRRLAKSKAALTGESLDKILNELVKMWVAGEIKLDVEEDDEE